MQIGKLQNPNRGKEIIAAIRCKATKNLTTDEIMQLTREEIRVVQ
ncbi:hypothetical protein [Okeania sp. SIO3I5]|nr:hypothetical protein [Okeania sp. SIO3I5]